ncbi:hypothetical protein TNCV_521791 [Trichonephila clavipes]|nr:hypothetical protein TNCV_521791 [Trichonephila clavipes]
MTRLQSVTLKLPEVGKNPVDTAYDVGSVVMCLSGRRLPSKPTTRSVVSLWFSLDGTGCLEGALPYHAPTEVAADTSIRPTCFSEAYYTAPIKVPSAARTAAGYVLEAS